MLVLYKIVNEDYESMIAKGKYKVKYEIGKWVEAPKGRLFCFRERRDAINEMYRRRANGIDYHVIKVEAREEETVFELEVMWYTGEFYFDRFYSGQAEWSEKWFCKTKYNFAFPKRVRVIEKIK